MDSWMMSMMVLMGGAGGNDLVDYVDTNAYWALQSVKEDRT